MSRRYLLRTFGCQMNDADSERLAGMLEAAGYVAAHDEADADIVVVNTCCIRENADNKLYGALGHLKSLKRDRPDMQIAVGGCLAQNDRDLILERADHVDVVFGTHNVHRAVDLLEHAREHGPVLEILEASARDDAELFPSALSSRRDVAHAAWLNIQIGCDNSCAFCIVPSVRGPEVSRSFGELVADAQALAADGVVEITLLGQNVNSYGRDLTTALRRAEPSPRDVDVAGDRWVADTRRRPRPLFADLLRAIGALDGVERIRFTSPHPKDLRDETIAAMVETSAVCEHLHLPLQSGNDRVLAAMHRGYSAERYLERLRRARETIEDLAVSTDVIVGFPGETEAEFDDTLAVVAEADYDSAFTFIYSPREGTEAATMTDRFVPRAVAVDRFERLRNVIERSARRRNEARIGLIDEAIVEGPSKRDAAMLTGRTRQNKLVHFASPKPLRAGALVTTRIERASPFHLGGSLVDVLRPAPRRRIPVAVA